MIIVRSMKQIWVNRSDVRVGDIVLDYHGDNEVIGKRHQGMKDMLDSEITATRTIDDIVPGAKENRIRVKRLEDGYHTHAGETGEVTQVRTLAKMSDGLKASTIFERFQENMRETGSRRWNLTPSQKTLAQAMWREELKLKQSAQKKVDAARAITVLVQVDCDE